MKTGQIPTYILFKTQSMLLSAKSRKDQPDADLHTVQNPEHVLSARIRKGKLDADLLPVQNPEYALVSNNQEGLARCSLTSCSKPQASSCQQQPRGASQMPTYTLHSMLLSATARKGQKDADLQAVQNTEHALISNNQEGPARCSLTSCSKHRACFCQQKPERASYMLTYILFKTQSMLLSATGGKGQPDADLQPVQNPQHALLKNNPEGPARC